MAKNKIPQSLKGNKPSNGSDSGRKDFHKAIRDARNKGRMDVIMAGIAIYVVSLIWKGKNK